MTDAHSAAASVKSVAEGAAAWLPLLQTLAGGVLAGGVALYVNHRSHKNALEREEKAAAERLRNERNAAAEKLARERYFIGTELVFLLEQFAEGCADVTKDFDYTSGDKSPQISSPVLDYTVVTGDWRALPHPLMYSIRELAVLHKEADRSVAASAGKDNSFHHYETVRERHYQYARLGIKAVIVARRLRKVAGFPDTRLDAMPWSAQWVLWKVWRNERHRRSVEAILRRQELARIEIKNAMRKQTNNKPVRGGSL
ncbi:MAG: hypothetical protein QRY16_19690 [Enterobacterales bacterium endosymbiont of Blomia tropicalis]|uniref:hypothetical protein n=1 Tax=Mixta mediterraneensis TaxID=2758443 RepID=UPI001C39B656|nr:hypothetical protein [Mixta mediterraneensis]MDL4915907.1 hypothetical protein [Mixta mediterraneensis]HBH6890050.1 hypothetical protein [Serratia marcescens]